MKNRFKIGDKVSVTRKYVDWECSHIVDLHGVRDSTMPFHGVSLQDTTSVLFWLLSQEFKLPPIGTVARIGADYVRVKLILHPTLADMLGRKAKRFTDVMSFEYEDLKRIHR